MILSVVSALWIYALIVVAASLLVEGFEIATRTGARFPEVAAGGIASGIGGYILLSLAGVI